MGPNCRKIYYRNFDSVFVWQLSLCLLKTTATLASHSVALFWSMTNFGTAQKNIIIFKGNITIIITIINTIFSSTAIHMESFKLALFSAPRHAHQKKWAWRCHEV